MENQQIRKALRVCAQAVRDTNPLVPAITNVITIDFVANTQLACGGSAAMVYMAEEGEAMAVAGQAIYINMGSMLPVHAEGVPATARACVAAGTPWVLDPVGIGIGSQRASILQQLRDCKPAIIRCNASEAIALADLWGLACAERDGVRGVDSTDAVETARLAAVALARHTGGAVMISGETDLVTDGKQVALIEGGSELMTSITGCGCSLGGAAAVFAACGDAFTAALAAAIAYDLAGIDAEADAHGPASFKVAFIDALYNTAPDDIAAYPFIVEEI